MYSCRRTGRQRGAGEGEGSAAAASQGGTQEGDQGGYCRDPGGGDMTGGSQGQGG
jgi:hypothetical protein